MLKILFLSPLIAASFLIATPKTVVFNYGGVLVGKGDHKAIANFIQSSFALSDLDLEIAYLTKEKAVKSQNVTDEDFWLTFAQTRQIPLPEDWAQTFKTIKQQSIQVNYDVYQIVEQLKKNNVRVALLSNVDNWRASLIRDLGLYDPFDLCILACEIGVKQPNLEVYQILLNALGHSPNEVLIIDDKQRNATSAKELGIDTIVFTSPIQLQLKLKERGLLETLPINPP